jgi:SAM-dependent methyltransferase
MTKQIASERAQTMHVNYDRIYAQGSSRMANEGQIGMRYRLPKYLSLLRERYAGRGPLDVLEIGAGVGEIALLLRESGLPMRRYVGTEYSLPALRQMRRQGFDCAQMNAERLAFPDNSFDLVVAFDVMHHVDVPQRMAAEIVRVTRRDFLLSESNGLSPLRKLVELTPKARALGERSYAPWTYRAFFPQEHLAAISTQPFYVLVPPYVPERLIPLVVAQSELGQYVAGWRWLGQSLLIVGEKRST